MLDRPIQALSVGLCVALVLAMLPAAYQGVLFAWHPMMLTLGFLGRVGREVRVVGFGLGLQTLRSWRAWRGRLVAAAVGVVTVRAACTADVDARPACAVRPHPPLPRHRHIS